MQEECAGLGRRYVAIGAEELGQVVECAGYFNGVAPSSVAPWIKQGMTQPGQEFFARDFGGAEALQVLRCNLAIEQFEVPGLQLAAKPIQREF